MDNRQFFVRSDNLLLPDELKGTQVINIQKNGTLVELYKAIRSRYRLPDWCVLQLWTGPMGMKGKRFDDKGEIIDSSIENVLIKIMPTPRHHRPTLPYDELDSSLPSPNYTC
jgi:hypothetical protein